MGSLSLVLTHPLVTVQVTSKYYLNHAIHSRFSSAVGAAGNYRMNGLKTSIDRPRFVDGGLDWMLN